MLTTYGCCVSRELEVRAYSPQEALRRVLEAQECQGQHDDDCEYCEAYRKCVEELRGEGMDLAEAADNARCNYTVR